MTLNKSNDLLDDALNAGTERNIGHEYIEHIEDRYSETARTTVPTGWDVIDDLTQGGLRWWRTWSDCCSCWCW